LANIEQSMLNICNVVTDNNYITLEVLGTERISVDKKYPGIRTNFMGKILAEAVRKTLIIETGN